MNVLSFFPGIPIAWGQVTDNVPNNAHAIDCHSAVNIQIFAVYIRRLEDIFGWWICCYAISHAERHRSRWSKGG